jgi:D-alanyl-D-alanine carboxypeptidase/D-alanyl-D-alanine-endopeptidase (penicillin-binding protein 4)
MKLTTAVAALGRLGPATRLRTRVLIDGTVSGSTLHGSLYLLGGGDPSLSKAAYSFKRFRGTSARVGRLASGVQAAGITHITGRVYGDESVFDRVRTGPYWRPIYSMDCPPLSALSVNEGWRRFGSTSSWPNQALHAAQVLRSSLIGRGVRVDGTAATRWHPASARALTGVSSPPIRTLVRQMNLPSDNFYGEVLNKGLAVARGLSGTTANGRLVTRRYLTSLGIDLTGARLYDGSGLSLGDRLSSRQLVSLLRKAHRQPYSWWLAASLPVAGTSGTLSDRMTQGPAFGNARAKTGTLRDASALSGYVHTSNNHLVIFSIVVNRGPYLNISAAQRLQDRIVQTLAGSRPR